MKHHRVRAARQKQKMRSAASVVIRCAAFLVLVIGCILGVRWMGEQTHSFSETNRQANLPSLSTLSTLEPATIQARNRRLVYPYSVVPGGVRSADELQSASAHDPVVAEHYHGFDYKHARLVEINQPKLVYLSYRRGDHVYWTRKRASLRVGEKLLTDGHTTARTRCGNQVSVLPQAETSPQEPTIAELDRPDAVASGREELFPSNLSTELLPLDPQLPLGSSPGNAFSGGPPPGGFMPLPIGGGSGPIKLPTGNGCPPNNTNSSKNCQHTPPPPPPPPVPEPGTVVLMLSGTAALIARYRHKR